MNALRLSEEKASTAVGDVLDRTGTRVSRRRADQQCLLHHHHLNVQSIAAGKGRNVAAEDRVGSPEIEQPHNLLEQPNLILWLHSQVAV